MPGKASDEFIERRIVTGLIVSENYLRTARSFPILDYLSSPELRRIANWALDYWDKYKEPADRDIQLAYMEELRTDRLPRDQAELVEEILERLSADYGRGEQFNDGYLLDRTIAWLRARHLQDNEEQVQALVDEDRLDEAEALKAEFKPITAGTSRGLELGSEASLEAVRKAFTDDAQRVLKFPGALGMMINPHLIRGGFVALLGPEKRGKSYWLLEFGMRAIRHRFNVAYFDAGDNTRNQVLRRICIYLSRRSDRETNAYLRPVGDCVLNQLDLCSRSDRNCDHGIFDLPEEDYYSNRERRESYKSLAPLVKEERAYRPCDSRTCDERRGTVWLEDQGPTELLDYKDAQKYLSWFIERYKRRFKLMDHPSNTLTLAEMRSCLDEWQQEDDFEPDVILVDYADLMTDSEADFRHRQDVVWKGLRGLSQERHALVVTATQSDAASYKARRLGKHHFSEDKRKNAHVTAMFGLNQDPKGRESRLGMMRINEIVVREGRSSVDHEVTVLQDLRAARAFLESYR